MALATSNLAQLRYIREAAFGTTPVAGNPSNLRNTGESLAYSIKSDTSKEIRSDRQVTDLVLTGASVSGGVNFELSYQEYDDLFEDALQSTWLGSSDLFSKSCTITLTNTVTGPAGSFAGVVAGDQIRFTGFTNAANNALLTVATFTDTVITVNEVLVNEGPVSVTISHMGKQTLSMATTSGTTLTATTATGSPFANVVAGQMIRISGMPTAANNKVAKVVSKTSDKILVFAAATFTNETGPTTTTHTSRLTNGTTQRSYTFERALNDVTQFFAYRGLTVNKMSMSFASGAIVTGSFDFMGKDSVRAATTALPGTPVASLTYDVMNAVAGVGNVLENGTALTGTFIKSLKLDSDNKLRARDAIGVLGAASIGSGTFSATGTAEIYLSDGTLYDKFINNTATSFAWTAQDGAGNGYAFQFPKVKFSDAKVAAGGLDQDVMLSIPFTALMDTTTAKTFIIDRL